MAQINPDKWLVAIAGFANDWIYSRKWSKILYTSIPVLLLATLAGASFGGGILSRSKLRDRYLELAESESQRWQDQLAKPLEESVDNSETPVKADSAAAPKTDPAVNEDHRQLSDYAQMLFRRAHFLEPSDRTQFVIGATMWQRGATANAVQILEKVAPQNQKGFPPAHAVLAKILWDDFTKSRNTALLPQFQHHANLAVEWPRAFPDVLLVQSNLLWQQGKHDRALNYLTQAAKNNPEFYVLLVERALQAGNSVLAQTTRKEAVEHFQEKITEDPKLEGNRIQLAQLLLTEPGGDVRAEAVLAEGQKLYPSKSYARALSEIYRIRFTRQFESSSGQSSIDTALLEQALQFDSNNPAIAQTIATLVQSGIKTNDQLGAELNRVLVSGQATMATHQILSEYRLQRGELSEAKSHLEQVCKLAPMSVKYVNNLAYLYYQEGRFDDGQQIAEQAVTLLNQSGAQNQPFMDELFDTLGMIYQSQKKTSDAIASYEASLKLNPLRINTRTRLIELYRKNGNQGVATAHEEAIRSIKKSQSEANAGTATQSTDESSSDGASPTSTSSATDVTPVP